MVKEKPILQLFLRPKPIRILMSLRKGPKYATILSKEVDCTYSHTVKLLDLFKNYGMVDFDKRGRIKIVKLTEVGENVAKTAESLFLKINRLKEKTEKK